MKEHRQYDLWGDPKESFYEKTNRFVYFNLLVLVHVLSAPTAVRLRCMSGPSSDSRIPDKSPSVLDIPDCGHKTSTFSLVDGGPRVIGPSVETTLSIQDGHGCGQIINVILKPKFH